jgi:CDGSH iron-sulfur domain-containing protein 3
MISRRHLFQEIEPLPALCDARNEFRFAKETIMADVTIRVLKSGPYEVAGGAKLLDHQSNEYQEDQFPPIYLCRCGQSKNKPFCDGSHTATGFRAEEMAS